jgi:hypothetical protein
MSVNHSEARGALAFPEEPSPEPRAASPFWTRPTSYRRSGSHNSPQHPRTFAGRMARNASKFQRQAWKHYSKLSILQRILLAVAGVITFVLSIMFLVYNERIFAWLAPVAKKWRDIPAGWLILWSLTFLVSFPPLIGYSSCVTIAGFVYGFPNGLVSYLLDACNKLLTCVQQLVYCSLCHHHRLYSFISTLPTPSPRLRITPDRKRSALCCACTHHQA